MLWSSSGALGSLLLDRRPPLSVSRDHALWPSRRRPCHNFTEADRAVRSCPLLWCQIFCCSWRASRLNISRVSSLCVVFLHHNITVRLSRIPDFIVTILPFLSSHSNLPVSLTFVRAWYCLISEVSLTGGEVRLCVHSSCHHRHHPQHHNVRGFEYNAICCLSGWSSLSNYTQPVKPMPKS